MDATSELEAAVRELLFSRAALSPRLPELDEGMRLGAGGLGLDSIAMVELLLDCERRFGIPRPAELLEGEPLTVGRLIAHVRAAAGR